MNQSAGLRLFSILIVYTYTYTILLYVYTHCTCHRTSVCTPHIQRTFQCSFLIPEDQAIFRTWQMTIGWSANVATVLWHRVAPDKWRIDTYPRSIPVGRRLYIDIYLLFHFMFLFLVLGMLELIVYIRTNNSYTTYWQARKKMRLTVFNCCWRRITVTATLVRGQRHKQTVRRQSFHLVVTITRQ
jgi:hypothetical protein